jgi:hypothetical protein
MPREPMRTISTGTPRTRASAAILATTWVTLQLSAARLKLRFARQRYQEFELANHRDAPVKTGKFCAPKAASRRAKALMNAAWLQARVFAEVCAPVA